MKVPGILTCVVFVVASVCSTAAQRNDPFAANPDSPASVAIARPALVVASIDQPTSAVITPNAVGRTVTSSEIYKVGSGDVLHIALVNAPSAAGYYSVGPDGSIDFPLAGAPSTVVGMTPDEVAGMLASRVTLYQNARLEVTVREFASHKIKVTGMVEQNGERSLQREAMPLFTIKAVVGVDQAARKVRVRRAGMTAAQTYDLRDDRTDDLLIKPGDTVEFIGN